MQDYENKYHDIISANIKEFRESKGFSQEFLAEQVDCTREFINRVENRKENVSLSMLLKLSFVFGEKPQKFFE